MIMIISTLLLSAVTWLQPTGSITGCIVDSMHAPLPGVTVVARGESVRGTTETNTLGCYNLKGLTPGAYRVTVRLQGFTNVTRDNVTVAAGAPTSLDLTMSVSHDCDCVVVKRTLADHVHEADSVLHVRIAGPKAGQPPGAATYEHKAVVLHVIKGSADPMSTIGLAQDQTSGSPDPYDVDDEMVVFQAQSSTTLVFPVRDGRIVSAPTPEFSKYAGMTLDAFLYELRQAAANR
jgi:Carboxypeptidase regulatory-like domain